MVSMCLVIFASRFSSVVRHLGTTATLSLSRWSCYGYDQHFEIFGDKGLITVASEHKNSVSVSNQTGEHHSRLKVSFPQRFREAFACEMDAFADVSVRQLSWPVSRQDAVAVMRVAEAALVSQKNDKVVQVAQSYSSKL